MGAMRAPAAPPPSQGSPRRFASVQMPAVDAPLSSGRMLDDNLDFDIDIDSDAGGALELDCLPSSHRTRVEQPRQLSHEAPPASRPRPMSHEAPPASRPRPMSHDPPASRPSPSPLARTMASRAETPPSSGRMAAAGPRRSSSSSHEVVDTHAALAAFAGFGDPPSGILDTPTYAMRVIMRRRALKADLARARLRRSPDVGLYEASLRTADAGAVRMGLVVSAVMLALGLALVAAALHLLVSSLLGFG